jgi:hypothetical protein
MHLICDCCANVSPIEFICYDGHIKIVNRLTELGSNIYPTCCMHTSVSSLAELGKVNITKKSMMITVTVFGDIL